MAKNKVQDGRIAQYTPSGADVASGDVVIMAGMAGVAITDIADGTPGSVDIESVYRLPKEAALAINQGDTVYWDTTAGEVDKTNTNEALGKAFKAAAADDTHVDVKLNV